MKIVPFAVGSCCNDQTKHRLAFKVALNMKRTVSHGFRFDYNFCHLGPVLRVDLSAVSLAILVIFPTSPARAGRGERERERERTSIIMINNDTYNARFSLAIIPYIATVDVAADCIMQSNASTTLSQANDEWLRGR
jgi:hypothetical protein